MTRLTRTTLTAFIGALLLLATACGDGEDAAEVPVVANEPVGPLLLRDVELFAALPEGARFAEGITANPANGDVYVGTFDAPSAQNPDPKNKLFRFDRNGALLGSHDFGKTPLLGLAFDPSDNHVYIANVGNFAGVESKIQRIAADLTGLADVAVIPEVGAPDARKVDNPDGSSDRITFGTGANVPNALALDNKGNLYVSDSFQGAVFKIGDPDSCARTCKVETFLHDPLLATTGFPPFAANGIAFNPDQSALFIANTGDDRVLKLDMGSAKKELTVFAESVNGADGIAFDKHGRLWVEANQADEVVALNEAGRVVARLGEFRGIGRDDGTPVGLLFPASLVIVGDDMYLTNLGEGLTAAVGDEPEEDVKRWTVSHIKVPAP